MYEARKAMTASTGELSAVVMTRNHLGLSPSRRLAGPQPCSPASKPRQQVQKCMPTVSRTMWLRKSYVPLAVCPPADGLGLNGGVLPVTVWSGPYPNW